MFGYVKPNIPELRVRDKTRYDAWYCGLCRRLGSKYGIVSRACLSYDCTFLALMLSAVSEQPCATIEPHRCTFKPFGKKKPMVAGESVALDFASAVCVLLTKYKLDDDAHDGKPMRGFAKIPLAGAFSKAKRDFPLANEVISSRLNKLSEIEKANIASPDIPANAFGELLRELLLISPSPSGCMSVLGEIGFQVGRYIYLLDAWDDRETDEKHGLYNPFVLAGADRSLAELLINISINSAISAYNLLDIHNEVDLLSNIICEGCFAAADRVFNKAKKQSDGRVGME